MPRTCSHPLILPGNRSLFRTVTTAFSSLKTFIDENDGMISGVQLATIDLTSPPPELNIVSIGSQKQGYAYNAMGYNPLDNYIYAIKKVSDGNDWRDLLRVDRNGDVAYVATLYSNNDESVVADFDTSGNFYVVDYSARLYKYSINGKSVVLQAQAPLNPIVYIQDMGFYDNALWSIATINNNYRIVRIDISPANFGKVELGATKQAPDILSFTSIFSAKNGVYGYDENNGHFVRIDMSSGDIAEMELQFLAKGHSMSGSDGARCQNAPLGLPAEIVVTKTADRESYLPGEPITFTITVTNQGPWGAADIRLQDVLPPGVASATWACVNQTATASCDPESGSGNLDANLTLPDRNSSVTYQVTMQTATNSAVDIVNTATVTVPEDFSDDPSNNTATATVKIPSSNLTATKTGTLVGSDGEFTSAGDLIEYVVTVKNDSVLQATNVSVVDPGPVFGGQFGTGTMTPFSPPAVTLAPGDEATFTATYTITEEDLSNLSAGGTVDVVNTAMISALDPAGNVVTAEASSVVQVVAPAVHVEKTGELIDLVGLPGLNGEVLPDAGDGIEYTFVVRNTGSVPLSDIVLTDPFVETLEVVQPDPRVDGVLGLGEAVVFKGSHTIVPEDIIRGEVLNVASVSANVVGRPDLSPIEHSTEHVMALEAGSSLLVEKLAGTDPQDTDGVLGPGDTLDYTVRLTNTGYVTLRNVFPVDYGVTFGGFPGTGILSPFQPGPRDLAPGESADFRATYVVTEEDLSRALDPESIRNVASATGETPDGGPIQRVNIDEAVLSPTVISVEKKPVFLQVLRGGKAPFVLTVKAPNTDKPMTFNLVDTMPVGFSYARGSARINGRTVEPQVQGRRLVFPLTLEPGEEVELSFQLDVSAAVEPGPAVNLAHTEYIDRPIAFGQRAEARFEVVIEPIFDCGDLVGKVFDDGNRDGMQNDGERGIAGVRLVAADGVVVTTDAAGRFRLTCADLPDRRMGSSFLLKLDPASLPTGYRVLSENPRVIRLTAGKVSSVSFAASITRVVRVDISSDAFIAGGAQLREEWFPRLAQLILILRGEPSVLRLSYIDQNSERKLATRRVDFLRNTIQKLWQERPGNYRLEIEARILNQLGQGWDDVESISWAIEPF